MGMVMEFIITILSTGIEFFILFKVDLILKATGLYCYPLL